jgi:Cdc6-like AAA superfamily ATPase
VQRKQSEQKTVKLAEMLRQAENPFDSDKVLRARDAITDVSEIHQKEFKKLRTELEKVRSSGKSRGILVTGVAGSGKSHLVARLYRERPREVLFFQVQALPGGTAWLKHILQCIVSDLEQPISREDETRQLAILMRHFIEGIRHELGQSDQSGYTLDTLNRALDARQRQILKRIPDPSVGDVLTVLANLWKWQSPSFRKRKPAQSRRKTDLAIQWLKAAMIDDEDFSEIGVQGNLNAEEGMGQSAYLNVLRLFGHLTAGQAPIILYFDQLDTMETETINSLGDQLLHLIGADTAAPNYLVVTAGVREEISKFLNEGIIKRAVADVIFKTELDLPALTMDQCLKIVEKRLKLLFSDRQRELLPNSADALFPLTTDFAAHKLRGPIKPSPRRVLTMAASAYDEIAGLASPAWLQNWPRVPPLLDEQQSGGPPSVQLINQFLQKELDKKISAGLQHKVTGPVDGDLLAETIHRLLKICDEGAGLRAAELPKGPYKKPTDSFFGIAVQDAGAGLAGIVVNNKNHGGSMKSCLNKSLGFLNAFDDAHRILLGRDAQSKMIDKWPSCVKPLENLAGTHRFLRMVFEPLEVATLLALDELRKEVPDLIIPSSREHDEHQITREDFSRFLMDKDPLLTLPFFENVRKLLTLEKPSPPGHAEAENFVRARVEAKCIIAFEELVTEWANRNERVNPIQSDIEEVDQATRVLSGKQLVISIGHGSKRILKKQ